MTYAELYKDFLTAVPEGAEFCEEKVKAAQLDEEDGAHLYFCFAVRPYISKVLHDDDKEALKKISDFMEEMETNEDKRVAGVLEQSVMEALLAEEREMVESKINYWGKETKEAFASVAQFIEAEGE